MSIESAHCNLKKLVKNIKFCVNYNKKTGYFYRKIHIKKLKSGCTFPVHPDFMIANISCFYAAGTIDTGTVDTNSVATAANEVAGCNAFKTS